VTITKGEAQARVVEVNAAAEAQRTTLEGNADAGITFTKGEAEAKALALRAEAYRQFNEAAIIQTVLSMLPDIVRAAAEPMSNIDTLTVLSNDGASDVVKNVTRTVVEAGTTVKGLTGIDIPEMLSQAMGTASENAPKPPAGGGGGSGGGRARAAGSAKAGGAASGGTSGSTTASAASGAPVAGDPPRHAPPPTRTTPPPTSTSAAPPAGTAAAATSPAAGAPPRFTTPESVDSAIADAERAVRAASAPPTPRTDTAAGPPRPASADINRATTLDDAATRLAADLRAVPGIERFSAVRLADLERSGPRPLRTMWRIAGERLDERYGQLTIGELLDRYNRPGRSS